MENLEFLNGEVLLKGLKWEVANSKANLILIEGMEEHTLRYDEFANFLNINKFNVYSLDFFGQGRNVNDDLSNIGVWPVNGFEKYIDTIHLLIESLGKEKPCYIFAHSMGSFMTQKFIQKYPNDVSKIILSGSGYKQGGISLALFMAKIGINKKNRDKKSKVLVNLMFGKFNNNIKNPKTEYDWLSYNSDNVNKYIQDPLCGFKSTKGFCLEFLKFFKKLYVKKSLENINKNLEILILSGIDDPVSNYTNFTFSLEKMYKALGIKSVHPIIYKECRHEIHNESLKIRNQEMDDILTFLNK